MTETETDHQSITENNLEDAGWTENSVVDISRAGVCQTVEDPSNSLTQHL